MFSSSKAAWLPMCLLAGLHGIPVFAQTAPPPALVTAPSPTDATAAVPAATYRSPFTGYQSFAEPAVAPWRDTNELVRQRGGWRAYAREAAEPSVKSPSAASAASAPASAPATTHRGHSGHGTP